MQDCNQCNSKSQEAFTESFGFKTHLHNISTVKYLCWHSTYSKTKIHKKAGRKQMLIDMYVIIGWSLNFTFSLFYKFIQHKDELPYLQKSFLKTY